MATYLKIASKVFGDILQNSQCTKAEGKLLKTISHFSLSTLRLEYAAGTFLRTDES